LKAQIVESFLITETEQWQGEDSVYHQDDNAKQTPMHDGMQATGPSQLIICTKTAHREHKINRREK
jgi:hypothetical protein